MPHFNATHGQTVNYKPTPEYRTWQAMRYRCNVPTNDRYRWYGARGIRVCERWDNNFAAFLADMGKKPTPKHTLDRIDGDGNYEPGNCRWATPKEQAANKPTTVLIAAFGETGSMSDWAQRVGICPGSLSRRLKRGWTVEEALTIPRRNPGPRRALDEASK